MPGMDALPESIARRIDADESGCWLWTGTRNPVSGYGQLSFDGKSAYAHRVVYELLVGQIPEGLHTDHLCRVRACVRPDHLEPVTCRENVHRSPIHPAAINARKTQCPQGHPYDEANTGHFQTSKGGAGRRCRACAREKQRAISPQRTLVDWSNSPDRCKNGHSVTPELTFTRKNGCRECVLCRRESLKRYRERRRES